jgi:hypothetical protein
MSPLDALYAFEDLRARLMIPIHHGAFALSYERVDEPARWLGELVRERGLDAHVRILAPGESELFVTPGTRRDGTSPGGGPAPGGGGLALRARPELMSGRVWGQGPAPVPTALPSIASDLDP